MAKKAEVDIVIGTSDVDNLIKSINEAEDATKGLRTQLREANEALQRLNDQEGADPKKIEAVSKRVGELRDKIAEANEKAEIFASGSKFEQVRTSFGQIMTDLGNMDFEGASEKAAGFRNVSKSITFGEAAKGVKDFGSTFMSIGRAMLANPIFLLASVIALIVKAIVDMLEKSGLLQVVMKALGKVFEVLMKPIEWLIEGLKKLTDWLGLSSFAAEEAAEKQAKAAKKAADASAAATAEIVQGLDNQIKMQKLLGKDTDDLEKQRAKRIKDNALLQKNSAKEEYEHAIERKKNGQEVTEEEIANLKKKATEQRLAYKQAISDEKYLQVELKKVKDDAKKEQDKADAEAEQERADAAKDAYKQRLADLKAYQQQRLEISRQIEDNHLALMKDGLDKQLKLVDINERRISEDLKQQLKDRELTQKEYNELIKLNEQMAIADRNKLYEAQDEKEKAAKKQQLADMKALDDKAWQDQKAVMDMKANYMAEGRAKELELSRIQNQQQYVDLQASLDSGLITREEYNSLVNEATTRFREDQAEINKKYDKQEEDAEKEKLTKRIAVYTNLKNIITGLRTEENSWLNGLITTGISAISAFTEIANTKFDKLKDKVNAYAQAIGGVLQGIVGAIADANKDKLEENIKNIEENTNKEKDLLESQYKNGTILKEEYDARLAKLDKQAKEKELAEKKKAFESEKKTKIASATIAGIQGAISAFTGAMSLGPIAGPIVGGVLAAAVAAMTAINISKIKSTKFDGGGDAGGGGMGGAIGGGTTEAASPTPPSLSLFGTAGSSTGQGQQDQGLRQQTMVKAVVVESDITNTQNRLATYQQRSEIG